MFHQFKKERQKNQTAPKSPFKKNFQVISTLSKGTNTKVFKVVEKSTKQEFVVKQINKNSLVRNCRIHTVFFEKLFLTYLNHPQIVKLHKTFQDEKNFYLVLQFLEGKNFSSVLKESVISPERIQDYFSQIVAILSYLHSKGVVHRDIKFDNFLEHEGKLFLIDFETAFIFDSIKA